jgi:hypothetical protein
VNFKYPVAYVYVMISYDKPNKKNWNMLYVETTKSQAFENQAQITHVNQKQIK